MLNHHTHFFISIFLAAFLPSFCSQLTHQSDGSSVPSFAFSWENENSTFVAGDVAIVKVKVLGEYQNEKYKYSFCPNISVNDKMGNSSYISGVNSEFGEDTDEWRISFIPIMVGLFNVLITDNHFNVLDSSLHFQVSPGKMYPAAGIVSWSGGADEFIAGTKATVLILPKDAFGNNVSSASDAANSYNFTVSAFSLNGSVATVLDVAYKGWNQFGYLSIELTVAMSGDLLLHIQEQNQALRGSPLPFKVIPGPLDVHNCVVQWNMTTKSFQLFSMMEAFILQHDRYRNLVPGMYAFDVEILENRTNLSIPIPDLSFKEIGLGIQAFSFKLDEPGDFKLMISDKDQKNFISYMPFHFTVYIGYCDGLKSIVNGSGLGRSSAGEDATFSVFLRDAYLYPSPVELEILQVRVLHESGSEELYPHIYPYISANGSSSGGSFNHVAGYNNEVSPVTAFDTKNKSLENSGFKSSNFEVVFVPRKSGIYGISICCGNILLNSGLPFRKEVTPGKVNHSFSGVVDYSKRVPKMMKNEIVVHLVDSYSNPVPLHHLKLKLEIASRNVSGFSISAFVDNKNGSYIGSYTAEDVGTYEICASYEGEHLMPCPFSVNVYNREYFPTASNDTVSVWEDESTAFDVLSNDYFSSGNASITEVSKPDHGSLLQYGRLFRYTPYKGFFGNDCFMYTLLDVNGNLASGSVNISILSVPPQFLSFPSQLHATEDLISPRFGGFSGLEVVYSDLTENITVLLSAHSGIISLSSMQMRFWNPIWNDLSVKNDLENNQLTLEGSLEVINFALQAIQYFGKENFSGEDIVQVTTMNRNGKNNLEIPIFVEPINDPPFINVPQTIIIEDLNEEVLLFDKKTDHFDFFIGDPDLASFPGNKSQFLVIFTLEVSSGQLRTNLPAELINTTELKLRTNYRWQPLQTFVTISKHFTVTAKAIRFRGTIDHCNSIMEQMYFQGGKLGAILTVSVNDMGNFGCYPNFDELMTKSLFSEATINIIRKKPMSSVAAYTLGSAIVVEFIVVLFLGMLLMFFMCKCALVLIHEKRRHVAKDIELSKLQNLHEHASSSGLTGKTTHFTDCCSSLLDSHHTSWHSAKGEGGEEEHIQVHDMNDSSPCTSDQHQLNLGSDSLQFASRKDTPTI